MSLICAESDRPLLYAKPFYIIVHRVRGGFCMTAVGVDIIGRIPKVHFREKAANEDWIVLNVYKGTSGKTMSGCWSLTGLEAAEFQFAVSLNDLEKFAPVTAARIRKYLPAFH